MSIPVESPRGRAALMVAHCAGMVDLVALSIWVGVLTTHYGFDAQRAGGLPTLFLTGVVLASVVLAPRFQRLPGRRVASAGFAISALGFWAAAGTTDYAALAALPALSGVAAGSALGVAHASTARSANPLRLFAPVGIALGVFAVVFLGGTPQLIAALGGTALFHTFAGVMAVGAVASALAFPSPEPLAVDAQHSVARLPKLPRIVWFGIAGISCMTVVQAMTFSF